jgi:CheY-like chemotaxis protein
MRRMSSDVCTWDSESGRPLLRLLDDLRHGLAADNAVPIIALAMLDHMLKFAQDDQTKHLWTLLMLGCWSVACKVCYDEAVFAIDIVNAWNESGVRPSNATVKDVEDAEYVVAKMFHWASLERSVVSFRSGMLRVIMQEPDEMGHVCRTQAALKVLIVDDDSFHVFAHSIAVRHACPDADTRVASSFDEATDALASNEWIPDVILVDLVMPDLEGGGASQDTHAGVSLAKQMRSQNTRMLSDLFNSNITINPWDEYGFHPSDALIVGLTALDFTENTRQDMCKECSFDAMCQKPLTAHKARAVMGMAWAAQVL